MPSREERDRVWGHLEAVLEVTQSILTGSGADQVLDMIARHARELAHSGLAAVALPDQEGDGFTIRVAEGTNAAQIRGLRLALDSSAVQRTLRRREPVVVEDLARDRDANPFGDAVSIGPALYVPMALEDGNRGTLIVANPAGSPPFSRADLTVAQLFGAAAALALRQAGTREALDRMRLLADRERISRELHDGVIQTLFSLGLRLQATAARSFEDEVSRRLQEDISTVDQVIQDLRSYIFELRSGMAQHQELEPALRRLAENFAAQTGVATLVDIAPDAAARVADKYREILPLVTEALSNVRRHAKASTCRIRLSSPADSAILEVEDDGHGFDPERAERRGHGIQNFRERAERLAADLRIESTSAGTMLRLTIPL